LSLLTLVVTNQFKRDAKLAQRRGKEMERLRHLIDRLQTGEALDPKHRDHALGGNWNHHRECHITPDWLLIYRIRESELILDRTGSHADLFDK
jgi:mRNA interferase YafQ